MAEDHISSVFESVQKLVSDGVIPGAVVLGSYQGKTVLDIAEGMRDIRCGAPMTGDTIFRIYSMTKPVTSVAIMMLVEAGKCTLSDPVERFLPELADRSVHVAANGQSTGCEAARSPITVRDLLRHTSGFTYGYYDATAVDEQYAAANLLSNRNSLAEFVSKLSVLPLAFHPGTQFCYGVSTDVLGRIIEVVSRMPLDQFLAEHIFRPLQMCDTCFQVREEQVGRLSCNYGPQKSGGLRVVDSAQRSRFRRPKKFLSAGAGLLSTAGDYMRFCQLLLQRGKYDGRRLLRTETVDAMLTDQLPKSAGPVQVASIAMPECGFGYGFGVVNQAEDAKTRIGECGWSGAACTHFWIHPRLQLAVVALTQVMPFSRLLEDTIKPIVYAHVGQMAGISDAGC